ncbi:hypothetical protein BJ742DRAFT_735390 [Cladochytrium replicatum]|nr:hypothetical protein BJ742DRAFT_735390 [Cladochytrium replicatum]
MPTSIAKCIQNEAVVVGSVMRIDVGMHMFTVTGSNAGSSDHIGYLIAGFLSNGPLSVVASFEGVLLLFAADDVWRTVNIRDFGYSGGHPHLKSGLLFDKNFANSDITGMADDFMVQSYLCSVLGETWNCRWVIIGLTGSRSTFQVDPNSTSASNAVITGSKKWIMFPPEAIPFRRVDIW